MNPPKDLLLYIVKKVPKGQTTVLPDYALHYRPGKKDLDCRVVAAWSAAAAAALVVLLSTVTGALCTGRKSSSDTK